MTRTTTTTDPFRKRAEEQVLHFIGSTEVPADVIETAIQRQALRLRTRLVDNILNGVLMEEQA